METGGDCKIGKLNVFKHLVQQSVPGLEIIGIAPIPSLFYPMLMTDSINWDQEISYAQDSF